MDKHNKLLSQFSKAKAFAEAADKAAGRLQLAAEKERKAAAARRIKDAVEHAKIFAESPNFPGERFSHSQSPVVYEKAGAPPATEVGLTQVKPAAPQDLDKEDDPVVVAKALSLQS